ncbi:MAG: SIMPL domain-containing protein [Thermomicrobium sp.]|nr:SIMPL domain-containing protein [Thermomicrobium sp.]
MRKTGLAGLVALGLVVLLGVVGTGLVSLRASDQVAAQETATPQRVISVYGEGRVTLPPDTATITLGAEIFDPDAAAAQREVERRMDAILAVFRQAGIPDNKMKTVVYAITVERDWQQPAAPVTGYRVTHLVEIQVQPVERVGELLGRAVQSGANVVSGVSFSVANPAAALRQARELAVRDAREKAAHLAQLTGVGLGAPVRIVESVSTPPIPVSVGQGADAKAIPAGEATVAVTVSIDYAIQ